MAEFNIDPADAFIVATRLLTDAAKVRSLYTKMGALRAPGDESTDMVILREQAESYERVAKQLAPSARAVEEVQS